jgi:hypothetical protein
MTPAPKPTAKRCTFELSPELHESIVQLAEQNYTTSTEVVRKFLKLGLLASEPDTTVFIRKGDEEYPVMLLI